MLPGDSFLSGHFSNPVSGHNGETVRCADRSEKNTHNGKTEGITSQEVSDSNVVFAEKGGILFVIGYLTLVLFVVKFFN